MPAFVYQFNPDDVALGDLVYCIGGTADKYGDSLAQSLEKRFDIVVTEWDEAKMLRLMRSQHEAWRYWESWNSKDPKPQKEPPKGPSMLVVLHDIFSKDLYLSSTFESLIKTRRRTKISLLVTTPTYTHYALLQRVADYKMFTSKLTRQLAQGFGITDSRYDAYVGSIQALRVYPWVVSKQWKLTHYFMDRPYDANYKCFLVDPVAAIDESQSTHKRKRGGRAKKVFSSIESALLLTHTPPVDKTPCLDDTKTICHKGGTYAMVAYEVEYGDEFCIIHDRAFDLIDKVVSTAPFVIEFVNHLSIEAKNMGTHYEAEVFQGFSLIAFPNIPVKVVAQQNGKCKQVVYLHGRILSSIPRYNHAQTSKTDWDCLTSTTERPKGIFVQGRATYRGKEQDYRVEMQNGKIVDIAPLVHD